MSDRDGFAAVILAAGSSSRLGRPKQTLLLHGETLLDRAVNTAREAGAAEIVVVLGAFADAVKAECKLHGCRTVLNSEWQSGMGSSIRAGVEALQDARGVLITTCDMPFVSVEHLRLLASSGSLKASDYGSGKGIPAYFPASYLPELLSLTGNVTAKHLLSVADAIKLQDAGMDIDTKEDAFAAYARLR